eukprot:jgi/Picre1/32491/NNA_007837.t1
MRKMLNAEKVMFRTDATGGVMMPKQRHDNKETCDQVVVTLSATPWGHFASNHPRDRFYYDIVLEKNYVGIPESGGSVVYDTLLVGCSCSFENRKNLPPEANLQTDKVFLHVDADCFYAQVEELRNKDLKHVPLGVTQKYLVVTCNYLARERGVRKLMGIADAKRICPEIRLVNGEDLNPYREYSDAVAEVLQTYGPIKKLGCDEMFVDVTDEAKKRLAGTSAAGTSWKGHVFIPSRGTVVESESSLRIMDLRAKHVPEGHAHMSTVADMEAPSTLLLKVGSEIAWEARRAIKIAVGVRTSAGIAHSMLVAKLISGLHKPDDQTILLAEHAREFVGPLPVRALVNVGSVLQKNSRSVGLSEPQGTIPPQLISLTAKRFHQEDSCGKSIASYFEAKPANDVGTLASKHSMRRARESCSKQNCGTMEPDRIDGESEGNQDDRFWGDLKACDVYAEGNSSSISKRPTPVSYRSEDAAAIVKAFQTDGGIALHSTKGIPSL